MTKGHIPSCKQLYWLYTLKGMSIKDITTKFGCSEYMVSKKIKECGTKKKK